MVLSECERIDPITVEQSTDTHTLVGNFLVDLAFSHILFMSFSRVTEISSKFNDLLRLLYTISKSYEEDLMILPLYLRQ